VGSQPTRWRLCEGVGDEGKTTCAFGTSAGDEALDGFEHPSA
jgi:hypothetical protein